MRNAVVSSCLTHYRWPCSRNYPLVCSKIAATSLKESLSVDVVGDGFLCLGRLLSMVASKMEDVSYHTYKIQMKRNWKKNFATIFVFDFLFWQPRATNENLLPRLLPPIAHRRRYQSTFSTSDQLLLLYQLLLGLLHGLLLLHCWSLP